MKALIKNKNNQKSNKTTPTTLNEEDPQHKNQEVVPIFATR
jgi:hypothetical protein